MRERTPEHLYRRAEVRGERETPKPGQPKTLAEYVATLAQTNASGIFTEIQLDGTTRSRTYGELFDDATKISAALRELKPRAREFAILCFDSVIDYVPAAWACLLSGTTFLPLSTSRFNSSAVQLSDRAQQLTANMAEPLVLTEGLLRETLSNALSLHQAPIVLDTAQLLAPPYDPATSFGTSRGSSDILIETSGTTSQPKLAWLGGDKIMNRLFDGIVADDRISLNLLVHHSVGGLRLLLPIGRRNIYLSLARMMSNPATWLDCVSQFRVTDIGMGTGMAARISEYLNCAHGGWDMSSLQRLAFGSETIAPPVIRRFISNLQNLGMGDATATLVYSMTETGPLFSSRLPARKLLDASLDCDGRYRLTRCADSWFVRVVRETGEVAAKGEFGKILVRSDSRMFRGYYPSGDGVAVDGWFNTGDLGSLDDQGLLLAGREKSTIAINSRKISCEAIETRLREIRGVKPGLAIAVPVRAEASSTDELAVFFVPRLDHDLDDPGRQILGTVAQHFGVKVSHLVPLREADLPLTPTGKVRRNELVELYRSNILRAFSPQRDTHVEGGLSPSPSPSQASLARLWKSVLKLDYPPSLRDNFFELGGDSLASAELVSAVEKEFQCDFPVEAFFDDPTIANLDKLLADGVRQSYRDAWFTHDLLRNLRIRSASWHGQRLFEDSLLVGFNVDGKRTPIVWVTQEYQEAAQLAKHLGPDQPLYVFRSCVDLVPTKDYSPEIIETVCKRYLWEMRAILIDREFVLGGTCQGGILALALARQLKQVDRSPVFLALLEWSFSQGKYEEPVLLLYGEESYTAAIYRRAEESRVKWRDDFPKSVTASIPGLHESLVIWDRSVRQLAKILTEYRPREEAYPTLPMLLDSEQGGEEASS